MINILDYCLNVNIIELQYNIIEYSQTLPTQNRTVQIGPVQVYTASITVEFNQNIFVVSFNRLNFNKLQKNKMTKIQMCSEPYSSYPYLI